MWFFSGECSCVLEKNVYSAVLDGMFWIYLLDPSGPICHSKPGFPCWFSVWKGWSILDRGGVLDSPTIIVSLPVSLYLLTAALYI